MTDTITITGTVGTDPRHLITGAGLAITSFRLASTLRRFDRTQNRWVDGDTNWYTVTTFRQLAFNTVASIKRGERVVVVGRVRIRDWQTNDKSGTNVDVEADAVGHDLTWGTTQYTRVLVASAQAGESVESGDSAARSDDADADADADADEFPSQDSVAGASIKSAPSIVAATSFDDLVAGDREHDRQHKETVPF